LSFTLLSLFRAFFDLLLFSRFPIRHFFTVPDQAFFPIDHYQDLHVFWALLLSLFRAFFFFVVPLENFSVAHFFVASFNLLMLSLSVPNHRTTFFGFMPLMRISLLFWALLLSLFRAFLFLFYPIDWRALCCTLFSTNYFCRVFFELYYLVFLGPFFFFFGSRSGIFWPLNFFGICFFELLGPFSFLCSYCLWPHLTCCSFWVWIEPHLFWISLFWCHYFLSPHFSPEILKGCLFDCAHWPHRRI